MLSAAIIVAIAVAALVCADRVAASITRHRVARLIGAAWHTPSAPDVRISGPFLVHLVVGVFRQVELSLPAFTAGGMDLLDLKASLTAVRAPMRRLLARDGLIIGEVSASFAIPFAALNKLVPAGFAVRRHRRELEIYSPMLALPVAGTVEIDADLRHIRVTPRVAGVPSLPALPPLVSIASITVTDTALALSVTGQQVPIAAAKRAKTNPRATSRAGWMRPWRAD